MLFQMCESRLEKKVFRVFEFVLRILFEVSLTLKPVATVFSYVEYKKFNHTLPFFDCGGATVRLFTERKVVYKRAISHLYISLENI